MATSFVFATGKSLGKWRPKFSTAVHFERFLSSATRESSYKTSVQLLTFLVLFRSCGTLPWTPPNAHNKPGLVWTPHVCTAHRYGTADTSETEARQLWSCYRPTARGNEKAGLFPGANTIYETLTSTNSSRVLNLHRQIFVSKQNWKTLLHNESLLNLKIIQKCNHSNESCWEVLSWSTVC